MNIKDAYNPTINFIDLLSHNAVQIINEIYNLQIYSPTTIHFYYQNVIKKNIVNEFDVIIDILQINNKDNNQKIDDILILIEDVKVKLNLLKELILNKLENKEEKDNSENKNDLKELKLSFFLINQLEVVLNQINVENENLYIIDVENKLISYENKEFLDFLNLLKNSFDNTKVSIWNLYNQKLIDTPYFLKNEQNFLREIELNDFIIFYLSDFINYELDIDWELISYLLFYQELQLKAILKYLSEFSEENLLESLFNTLYNKDNLFQDYLNYLKNFVDLKNFQKQILQDFILKIEKEGINCIICKENKIDFVYFNCPKCDIYYIDLITTADSIKLLFYLLILSEFDLLYENVINFRDYLYSLINKNTKIYNKIGYIQLDLLYINQMIGKIKEIESIISILDEIIKILESKKELEILDISNISKKLYEINNKLELILFSMI
jgi:hypothetical protein